MTIRRTPEDFEVIERLFEARRPAGARAAHAVFRLTKTSLTTPHAAGLLARALGVRAGAVSWAGLKDKHGVTTQHLSAEWSRNADPPPVTSDRGWRATFAGWAPRPLDAEAIEANEFAIVVRDLSPAAASLLVDRAALLTSEATDGTRTLRFINYFGDQRFASARPGLPFAGLHLARGEFEAALKSVIAQPHRKDMGAKRIATRLLASRWGDWTGLASDLKPGPARRPVEVLAGGGTFAQAFAALPAVDQQFAVEAFQSHVWNDCVRRMVASLAHPHVIAPDPFGALLFPRPADIPPGWTSLQVPMPGESVSSGDGQPWHSTMRAALAANGLSEGPIAVPGLRRPAFRGAMRPVVANASGFESTSPRTCELSRPGRLRVDLRFTLPRGAYATVLLRALGQ